MLQPMRQNENVVMSQQPMRKQESMVVQHSQLYRTCLQQVQSQKSFTHQNTTSTQRLRMVQSPSTSISPFHRDLSRNNSQQRCVYINLNDQSQQYQKQNINWMNTNPNQQIHYSNNESTQRLRNADSSVESNEYVLNETIHKLDYLEKKIANIMEKNDQLRRILKKTEQSSEKAVDSFTNYLSENKSPTQSSNNNRSFN